MLERLGQVSVVALDKTGTLTEGHAELVRGDDEVLRLAASADALSTHPLAAALVEAAHRRHLALETAHGFREQYGDGVEAVIAGRRVRVGRSAFVGQEPIERVPGEVDVHVSIDGEPAGVLTLADRVRPSAIETISSLRGLGTRVLMLSGDDQAVADRVAAAVGVERVEAGATPQGKSNVVAALRRSGDVVAMVGDGVNDAPALALADVGIALAARGATISSATADVVITVDDIARVAEAIAGGKRTLRIARQGIALGMGLSAALMVVAADGSAPTRVGRRRPGGHRRRGDRQRAARTSRCSDEAACGDFPQAQAADAPTTGAAASRMIGGAMITGEESHPE